jgi:organic radical activating enzyme
LTTSATKKYDQAESFHEFAPTSSKCGLAEQITRAKNIIKAAETNKTVPKGQKEIISVVYKGLDKADSTDGFVLSFYEADEMRLLEDGKIIDYLYHRYRYVVYPKSKVLDDYPPLLQIEPTSICNFRCVFCYQTDESFTKKSSGYMGTMKLDLFKQVIDEIEGKVGFITMASRGEPLLAKDLPKMLDYVSGKFVTVKLNTNASVLTTKQIHSILSSGVNTLVFSADAADHETYKKLRVNGSLAKVIKNIELFREIKEKEYPDAKVITRVSGVMYDPQRQTLSSMKKLWGPLVDQISFVKYCPWESIYQATPNKIVEPCSDLWRRMFVWFDGSVNPCDSDYRSGLSVGSMPTRSLTELWRSEAFDILRREHIESRRQAVRPCSGCTVV